MAGVAGSALLAAMPAEAALPLVSACTGASLPASRLTPLLTDLTKGIFQPLVPIPVIGPALLAGVAGIVNGAVTGKTIGLDVLTVGGGVLTPGSACAQQADGFTLTTAKGISIGGNSIDGLGSGTGAVAGALSAIAFGNGASTGANIADAVAIGRGAVANTTGSVSLGAGSVDKAATPTAGATIGGTAYTFAGATPTSVVSVGAPGATRQIVNVAAGQLTAASTDAVNGSQLFATNTQVGVNSTAINNIVNNGTGIKYFHANSAGADSVATGPESVAVGPTVVANGFGAVAVGNTGTTTVGLYDVAIGSSTGNGSNTANNFYNTIVGGLSGQGLNGSGNSIFGEGAGSVTGMNNTSIGFHSGLTVTGNQNTYLGAGAGRTIVGTGNIGLGLNSGWDVAGNSNIAIGTFAGRFVTANQTVSIGSGGDGANALIGTFATATGGVALGGNAVSGAQSLAADGIAIGGQSSVSAAGTSAVALGRGATTTVANSVALGSGSTITAAPTGVAYNTGGPAPAAQVEIGGRRITGVSAGSAPTDGVNVSQLAGVAGNLAGTVNGSFSATGVYTPPTYTTANGTTATTVQGALTNETAGITNLGNSVATNQGGGATYNATTGAVTAPAYSVSNVSAAGAVGARTTAADTTTAVAGLSTSLDNLAGTVTAGTTGPIQRTGPATNVLTTVATGGTAAAPGAAQTLTNIAAGGVNATSTDAVNGSQLFATNANVATNATNLNTLGNSTAAGLGGGSTYTAAGGVTAPSYTVATISGTGAVGAPTTQTSVGGAVSSLSTDVTNLATNVNAGTVGPVQQTGTPNTLALVAPGGTGALPGTAQKLGNVAAGVATTDAVNVGQLNAVGAVAANSVQYDNAGKTAVTLGGIGAATPTTLTNVAPATLTAASTDAVNGGQLFATNTNVTNNTTAINNLNNGTAGLVQQAAAGAPITVGAATGGTVVNIAGVGGTTRTLSGVTAGVAATDAVNLGQVGSLIGSTAAAAPIQYSTIAAPTTANPGVVSNDTTLVGLVAGTPVALHNVAPAVLGATSTDAVNGSQLFATNANVTTNTTAIATNTVNIAGNTTAITNLSASVNAGTIGTVQRTATPNGLALVAPGGTGIAPGAAQTLSNVAAGVAPTDAANVGQVTAAVTAGNANAVQYDNAGKTAVTLGGVGAATPTTLTNVAPAALTAASTDAVNGAQLFATNTGVGGIAGVVGGTYNPATGTYTGPTYSTVGGTSATTVQGAFNNYNTALTGLTNGTAGLVQQASPTAPITVGAATGGTVVNVAGTAGNRTVTGVAPGSLAAGSVDAVNGGQIAALGTGIATNLGGGSTYDPATGTVTAPTYTVQGVAYNNVGAAIAGLDSGVTGNTTSITNLTNTINAGTVGTVQRTGVANGLALTAVGGTGAAPGAAQTLGNVAAGVATTDAVNVGQLNAVGGLASNSVQYDTVGGTKANSVTLAGGAAGPVKVTNVAAGTLSATSSDAVTGAQLFATNAQTATNTTNIAGNTTAITNLNNGTSGIVQQTGGSPGAGPITVGAATGGTVVNIAGTSGTRTLTGLSNGVNGTDAVTVAQINGLTNGGLNTVLYDPSASGGRSNSITLTGGAAGPVTITNLAAGSLAPGSTDAVTGGQLATTNAQLASNTTNIAGNTSTINRIVSGQAGAFQSNNAAAAPAPVATGANATAGGFGSSATGAGGLALGNGATSTGTGSVALGSGSTDGGVARVVSVGSVGNERRITNVGPAVNGTDAVNFSQLQAATTAFGTTATGLQNQLNQTNFDLNQVRRRANGGTAGAMAVAGLPQAFEPGKTMVGGAFGFWADQVAFAVGASGIVGDNAVVKVGASISGQGIGGFNVGAGWQF